VLALAAVMSGGWTAVTAHAEDPPPTATDQTDYKSLFEDKLAAALKVDRATLEADVKQAAQQTVSEAVNNGDLTQKQATHINMCIQQQSDLNVYRCFHHKHGHHAAQPGGAQSGYSQQQGGAPSGGGMQPGGGTQGGQYGAPSGQQGAPQGGHQGGSNETYTP
jgi:hypothetical protein